MSCGGVGKEIWNHDCILYTYIYVYTLYIVQAKEQRDDSAFYNVFTVERTQKWAFILLLCLCVKGISRFLFPWLCFGVGVGISSAQNTEYRRRKEDKSDGRNMSEWVMNWGRNWIETKDKRRFQRETKQEQSSLLLRLLLFLLSYSSSSSCKVLL